MTPGKAKIQVLPELDPPGWPYVDDHLSVGQKVEWSQLVSSWMNSEITAKNDDGSPLTGGGGVIRTPLTQFFNGTVTPYDTEQGAQRVTWIGFPGLVCFTLLSLCSESGILTMLCFADHETIP
jgi:hypothetical protein